MSKVHANQKLGAYNPQNRLYQIPLEPKKENDILEEFEIKHKN